MNELKNKFQTKFILSIIVDEKTPPLEAIFDKRESAEEYGKNCSKSMSQKIHSYSVREVVFMDEMYFLFLKYQWGNS